MLGRAHTRAHIHWHRFTCTLRVGTVDAAPCSWWHMLSKCALRRSQYRLRTYGTASATSSPTMRRMHASSCAICGLLHRWLRGHGQWPVGCVPQYMTACTCRPMPALHASSGWDWKSTTGLAWPGLKYACMYVAAAFIMLLCGWLKCQRGQGAVAVMLMSGCHAFGHEWHLEKVHPCRHTVPAQPAAGTACAECKRNSLHTGGAEQRRRLESSFCSPRSISHCFKF